MKLNERGLLIVISGPSGVGKGTVRKALFEREKHNLEYSVSMTTRVPRHGETGGIDYFFVTKEQFEHKIQAGGLLEYAEFVGNYYGTPMDYVENRLDQGKEVVLEIEVQGAMQVRERMPDAVFIFIAPPSRQALRDRITKRATEPEAIINKRMAKAEREFGMAHKYDYIVVNDTVENAADRIMAIIRAEHAKTERTIHKYMKILEVE
ncbi:guanylate kinase [Mycoplasmatota bacterium]|nr:guanylate kinase [Mycoplasmatota bacterium]